MVAGLLLAIVTGLLWAVLGTLFSTVVRRRLTVIGFLQLSTFLSAAVAWALVVRWPVLLNGSVPNLLGLAAAQLGSGLAGALGFFAMQRAMRTGHHGPIWTISQSAMVFPFLVGLLCWHEPVQPSGVAGICLIVTSLILLGRAQKPTTVNEPTDRQWFAYALLTFGLFGACQVLAAIPSHWPGWTDTAQLRPALYLTGSGVAYWLAGYVTAVPSRRSVGWLAVGHAAAVVAALCTLFLAMDRLAPHDQLKVVYPITVGVCIAAFAIYASLHARERLGWAGSLGVTAAIAGVALIAI